MPTALKFILLLVGAAVLALFTRLLLANMMRTPAPTEEPTRTVMVAAADLPAGLLLRAEDIEWKTLPKSALPDGVIIEGSTEADTLSGVLLRRDLDAGDFVLSRNVIRHDAPGFLSAALQPGMRAVSVAIDNVSGNAGLIQPGDYVDMILVQQTRTSDHIDENRSRSVVGETVVENARIIAVGSVFQQDGGHTPSGRQAPARTVTIEVMPRAAEAVSVAGRLGTLTLALRSFAVTDPDARRAEPAGAVVAWGTDDKPAPVWAGDVSRAIERSAPPAPATSEPSTISSTPAPPAVQASREIIIMRGAQRDAQIMGAAAPTAP